MDTRFFPQPNYLKVPLYPETYTLRSSFIYLRSSSKDFLTYVSSHYKVKSNQILLASRASEALMIFLKWLKNYEKKILYIALPSFCCYDIIEAILSAEAVPYFIETQLDGTFTDKSIIAAKKAGCTAVILPQFFGDRVHTQGELVKQLGMIFINDEAQAFPSAYSNNADISLFSCGISKKISACGGGGICLHNTEFAKLFHREQTHSHFCFSEIIENIQNLLKKRLTATNRSFANFLNLTPHLESDLKVLLEKKSLGCPSLVYKPMSLYQQNMAMIMIQRFHDAYEEHRHSSDYLKKVIQNKFGPRSTEMIKEINCPSIFAISVPSRFLVASKLAQKGIQTTWYYYPLNCLDSLKFYPTETTPLTLQLSKEILILPFQWKHTTKQFKTLVETLSYENF